MAEAPHDRIGPGHTSGRRTGPRMAAGVSPSREIEHPVTGERIAFLRTGRETGGALLEMDDFWARLDHRTPEHIHPAMEERWELIAGTVRFRVDGVERTLRPGETIVAPPGTRHTAASIGNEPAHLRIQMRPALRWQEFVERLFALAGGGVGEERGAMYALMREFRREVLPVSPRSR